MNTITEENYIKTIYHLQMDEQTSVSTSLIAEKLQTKSSSVTDMIKKLADKQLVNYQKYQGVTLTKNGELIAVDIIRKHRLWEVFLFEHLNYGWDEVHNLAEQLEHIKSNTLVDKLDQYLGFPKFDPHGDPIPDRNGKTSSKRGETLTSMSVGQTYKVTGVVDDDAKFLNYLDKLGIKLNSRLTLISREPFDNSMQIQLDNGKKFQVSEQTTKHLYVIKEML